MMKTLLRGAMHRFSDRYDYDTSYLEELLDQSLGAFLKLGALQPMASHRAGVSLTSWHAANLRATLREDCGPCVQLACNLALEAGLSASSARAVLEGDIESLPVDEALAVRYADAVLERSTEAVDLARAIVERWGKDGLVALAFAITTSRIYPTVKYALGHGQTCQSVQVRGESVVISPRAESAV